MTDQGQRQRHLGQRVALLGLIGLLWAVAWRPVGAESQAVACDFDWNANGQVDAGDLGLVATTWRTRDLRGDLNGDGRVATVDMQAAARFWGATCGWPSDPARFQMGGMTAFWGDPLWHLSHGTTHEVYDTPENAYARAKAAGYDWLAITEQDIFMTDAFWARMGAAQRAAEVPRRFVAMRSFEATGDYNHGHFNIYESDGWARFPDLRESYDWMAPQPRVFGMFNHPWAGGPNDAYTDWDFYDWQSHPRAPTRMGLVQNLLNGQWEEGLRAGWPLSATGTQIPFNSFVRGRNGLMARDLTHSEIAEALRVGRLFGTNENQPGLAIALRSGATWMGESIPAAGQVTVTVTARDLAGGQVSGMTLVEVQSCSAATVAQRTVSGSEASWTVSVPRRGTALYATVQGSRGTRAWTAPIFTTSRIALPADRPVTEMTLAPDALAALSAWEADTPRPWGGISLRNEGVKGTLLHFDLRQLPAGQRIVGAALELTYEDRRGTATLPFAAYAMRRPWALREATWNQPSAGQRWALPGAAGASDRDLAPIATAQVRDPGRYSLDVTDLAVRWRANAGQNYGLMLESRCATGSSVEYRFKANISADDGPRLRLWMVSSP